MKDMLKTDDTRFTIVGMFNTKEEVMEINGVRFYFLIAIRSRFLGKQARLRMLKGDFSNKPMKEQTKQIKKKKVNGYA